MEGVNRLIKLALFCLGLFMTGHAVFMGIKDGFAGSSVGLIIFGVIVMAIMGVGIRSDIKDSKEE